MKQFNVTVNGVSYDVLVEEVVSQNEESGAAPAAVSPKAKPAPVAKSSAAPAGSVAVKAPLQGTVVNVPVKPGDHVTRGAAVCVIEALKMETSVPAPQDGTVASVQVQKGATVKTDEILLTLK